MARYPNEWCPKMLTEHLCAQQSIAPDDFTRNEIQRLINVLRLHRPTGSDGKHGTLHTPTCGCGDGTVDAESWERWQHVPTGVKYRGTHRDGTPTESQWVNRDGECWVLLRGLPTHRESYRDVNSVAPFVRVTD